MGKTKKPSERTDRINRWYHVALSRELLSEVAAGFTDSIVTQVCMMQSYFLFHGVSLSKKIFHSPLHIYWIFYWFHCNILDKFVWGNTTRNSIVYLYRNAAKHSLTHIITLIIWQYASIFFGLFATLKFIGATERNPMIATEMTHLLVGEENYPQSLTFYNYVVFIFVTLFFQMSDRFINGLIETFGPLLKRYTFIFDGSWSQITLRCLFMHYLIIHDYMLPIVNPNYSFYPCLYYTRWSYYDLIVLTLPYTTIIVWEMFFERIPWLHNAKYFQKKTKKKLL